MKDNQDAKILIVDDEPYVCEVLSRWMSAEGYHCVAVPDAKAACEALECGKFTLVICDIMMPGMSGIGLLAVIRERFPDMAVVMVTGVNDRKTATRALKLGAFGYVIKPFDQNEVMINVANALQRRKLTLMAKEYERRLEAEVRERTDEVRIREQEIVLRLMSASEYRDDETGAHIRRIGLYSAALAEAAGWERDRTDLIRLAGPMHDIGKIGVPDTILLKPGKLTGEEFDLIKTHSDIGACILGGSKIPLLATARQIALAHHERWDSSGYPHGLSGEDIPECARIVAIADVYDALISHRVYRPALPEDEAIALMTEERGKQFDPHLFDLFLSVLPEFRCIRGIVDYVELQSPGKGEYPGEQADTLRRIWSAFGVEIIRATETTEAGPVPVYPGAK